jgi:hypothetical protein
MVVVYGEQTPDTVQAPVQTGRVMYSRWTIPSRIWTGRALASTDVSGKTGAEISLPSPCSSARLPESPGPGHGPHTPCLLSHYRPMEML